jgi:radical SAM protein with 4Fe4S-binding SPASM domain
LHCFHGGVGYDPSKRSQTLSFAQYAGIFEEIRRLKIANISIAGGGEPFADKRTPALIDEALRHDLGVRVVTHGCLITEVSIPVLLQCSAVRFSVDAGYATTYAQVHKVSKTEFTKAIENIARLAAARKRIGRGPEIAASFLVSKANAGELSVFCELMHSIGVDAVLIKHDIYVSEAGDSDRLKECVELLRNKFPGFVEARENVFASWSAHRCFAPHLMTVINPYGEVFSCALASQPGDRNGYSLGNVRDESFASVWVKSAPLRSTMRSQGTHCSSCNHSDILTNAAISDRLPIILARTSL